MNDINLIIPNTTSTIYNTPLSLPVTTALENATYTQLTEQPQQYVYLFSSDNTPPVLGITKEGIYHIDSLLQFIYYNLNEYNIKYAGNTSNTCSGGFNILCFNGTLSYINYSNIFDVALTQSYSDSVKFINGNPNVEYTYSIYFPKPGSSLQNLQYGYDYIVVKNKFKDYGYTQDLNYQITSCINNDKSAGYSSGQKVCDNIMLKSCNVTDLPKEMKESGQCDCILYQGNICGNASCTNGDYYLTSNLQNATNNCKVNLYNCIQNNLEIVFNKSKAKSKQYCNVSQFITTQDIIIFAIIIGLILLIIIVIIIIIIKSVNRNKDKKDKDKKDKNN